MSQIKDIIIAAARQGKPLNKLGPDLMEAGIKPIQTKFDDYEAVRFPQQGTLHEAMELQQDGLITFKQLQQVADSVAKAMAP